MANTFELIASSTVGVTPVTSIDFTSIPSTYTDLQILLSARTSNPAGSSQAYISFNGSTSGFSSRFLNGNGATATSSTLAQFIGQIDSAGYTANTFANTSVYIPNYAGSTNKSYSADSVAETNAATAESGLIAGLWSNTAAIGSISITTGATLTFLQYTTAYLYGVKNS